MPDPGVDIPLMSVAIALEEAWEKAGHPPGEDALRQMEIANARGFDRYVAYCRAHGFNPGDPRSPWDLYFFLMDLRPGIPPDLTLSASVEMLECAPNPAKPGRYDRMRKEWD